jgi:hypothetical protein
MTVAIVVLALAGTARAQPGLTGPTDVVVQLTVDEQWLLQRGYITSDEHVLGAIGSLFLPFGLGQAIQGRWSDTGRMFAIGEAVSGGAFALGAVSSVGCLDGCSRHAENAVVALAVGGLIGMAVFRVWEIVDAFVGPYGHNDRVRSLHRRLGVRPVYGGAPYVAPSPDGAGAVAGVSLRF